MKKILLFLLLLMFLNALHAQQNEEQFNIPVNYLLYLPQDYGKDTTKVWPLMLFLHGSGEAGTDLQKVKVHGPPKLVDQGKQFPFIIVSPQAPPNEGWEPQVIVRLIYDLEKKYKVDIDRIYLTGLSMGGFGTWSIAMKFPWIFAAIAPICGGGDTADISKLKHMPVWCFHGAKDNVVKPEQSYHMINALKKYNKDVRLTIYPEANHDSWTATYNNDSLYSWFLEHKRFKLQEKQMTDKELGEYAGGYAQKGMDTVYLMAEKGKLVIKNQPGLEIVPSTEKNTFFFYGGDRQLEIKFVRNSKGAIQKLLLYEDKIVEFLKVKK